ncbi:hypothetical protein HYZ05_00705 [Candidatus Daviesbacteria bacterium]|nr:hypothetical protein [Candidatus Daviesbacteria bacterium]
MAELSGDQRRVRDIARSFTEVPTRDSLLTRWKQGLQERFGIGSFITRADVKGGVGDRLVVKLGRVTLNDRLPEGVEFRGYRHVEKDGDKDGYSSTSLHFYDPVRRHIGLTVECAPTAHFKLPINRTPLAGLVILHEMGHAWDDAENPDNRVLQIQNSLPTEVLESIDDDSIRAWYSKAQADARVFGNRPESAEWLRRSVENSLKGQATKVAHDLMFSKQAGMARLVTYAQFVDIADEVAQKIIDRVLARSYSLSSAEDLAYAIRTARDIAKVEQDKFFRKFVKDKEITAWEWAEEEKGRLKKLDSRINLWDGNESALVLLKAYFVLHHPEVKFKDLPEGELKRLLEAITDLNKVFEW